MAALKRSPLAPKRFARLPQIDRVKLACASSGTGYRGRDDLMLITLPEDTAIAGVLTNSKTASPPVDWCRKNLGRGKARAILVNAGNANAFTGSVGVRAVSAIAKALGDILDVPPSSIFQASTGVIGETLEHEKIISHLSDLGERASEGDWLDAARAIMTTDTFPKLATQSFKIGSRAYVLNGIAKGSGMIAPDMATMLAFLVTDAPVAAPVLKQLLADVIPRTFNAITVDSDTSTSDTVLLCATGLAEARPRSVVHNLNGRRLSGFKRALEALCLDLAHQIVRDGEGAGKFITVKVTGAENDHAARVIGKAIANSPLVKTAIAGADANWGRIVMAVGKSGEAADRDRLDISIGGVKVARRGAIDPAYRESMLTRHMKGREIDIAVDVGVGRGAGVVWTCDLTHGYIDINADYRS